MPDRPKRWGEEGYVYNQGETLPGDPNNPYPGPDADWNSYRPLDATDDLTKILQLHAIVVAQLKDWWTYAIGLEQELDDTRTQRDTLADQLAGCQAGYAELEEQQAETAIQLAASQSAYTAQAAELDAAVAARDDLTEQLAASGESNADLTASLSSAQADLATRTDERDAARAERDDLSGQLATLTAEYNTLDEQMAVTAADLAACNSAKAQCDCPENNG